MTRFQGFETEKEAKTFAKEHGGIICGNESKKKDNRDYHQMAVCYGGLNGEKYTWSVQWNEVK